MEATDLTKKKCVPCRGGIPPMKPEEARDFLNATPEWSLSEDGTRISRRCSFPSFLEAIDFVVRAADLAEDEDHHPDFGIHYIEVEVILWTHKIGGLHENDFIMAAKLDELL